MKRVIISIVLSMLCSFFVFPGMQVNAETANGTAENEEQVIESQEVYITVVNLSSESNKPLARSVYTLYAAENIRNDDREVVVKRDTAVATQVTDTEGKTVFHMTLPVGKYYLLQEACPSGYVIDKTKVEIEVEKDKFEYTKTLYNTYKDGSVVLAADMPDTVENGSETSITVTSVKNESKLKVNNFVLTVDLPVNTALVSVDTGKYNQKLVISLYYKTNLGSDWYFWYSVLTDESVHLDVQTLPLADREYVTSFMIDYGTVEGGFDLTGDDKLSYAIKTGYNIENGTKLKNHLNLSAYLDGTKTTADVNETINTKFNMDRATVITGDDGGELDEESLSVSLSEENESDNQKTSYSGSPETGDQTVILPYIIGFLILAGAITGAVIIYVLKRKKK